MDQSAILTLNAGSSSLKFALFSRDPGYNRIVDGIVEEIGGPAARLSIRRRGSDQTAVPGGDLGSHDAAFTRVLDAIGESANGWNIEAVGHRVAHGGPDCDCPKRVTPALKEMLHGIVHLAPLHLPANLAGIAAVTARRPGLPQVACFDTAFHRDLPRLAKMTGLPREIDRPELTRYGYHGLSCEYILRTLRDDGAEVDRERIIIAHLGNGASMTAIKSGRSVETTMGFSTLSGLPMGTRSGDIDPGLVLYLLRETGLTAESLEALLFNRSGLLGLSGLSNDMRVLLDSPDNRAAEAVDYFCYHVRRQLAGLTAVLGGLDRLVFTGGIGANAAEVRQQICKDLAHIGIGLDPEANARGDVRICAPNARVVIEARTTDEEAMIASHVSETLAADSCSVKEKP